MAGTATRLCFHRHMLNHVNAEFYVTFPEGGLPATVSDLKAHLIATESDRFPTLTADNVQFLRVYAPKSAAAAAAAPTVIEHAPGFSNEMEGATPDSEPWFELKDHYPLADVVDACPQPGQADHGADFDGTAACLHFDHRCNKMRCGPGNGMKWL